MSYASEVLADSPIVYLRLGESSGTAAADTSGNSHPGTYNGSPTLGATGLLTGDTDTAMSADGVNDDCVVTGIVDFIPETTGALTVELWYKGTTVGSNSANTAGALAVCNDSSVAKRWCMEIDNAGKVRFRSDGSMATVLQGATVINDNVRHHIVVTVSGSTAKVYIDGSLDATGTYSASATGVPNLTIAANPRAPTLTAGLFDEVAIYPTALSAARVSSHWSTGSAGALVIHPTGIPTAEALGTAVVGTGVLAISPTGIASAEALGTAAVALTNVAHVYAKFPLSAMRKLVDLGSDNLRAIALSAYTVGTTRETAQYVADVLAVATQSSGGSYPAGGVLLTGVTLTPSDDDIIVSCGTINFSSSDIPVAFVLFADTTPGSNATNPVILYWDLGATRMLSGITVDPSGLLVAVAN